MSRRMIAAWVATGLVGCVSHVKPLPPIAPAPLDPKPLTFSENARQARLKAVVNDLPLGHKYGEVAWGYRGNCFERRPLVNTHGRFELESDVYATAFNEVMKKRGYSVEDALELFRDSKERVADLQVAARIVGATLNECFPKYGDNKLLVRGSAHLKVEWSIYSTLEKKVIYVTTTEGSTRGEVTTEVGEKGLLVPAFADAAGFLANSREYRDVIDPPAAAEAPSAPLADRIKIRRVAEFSGPLEGRVEAIRSSVATVTANRGSGSGFVLSAEGIIVTSEHVVSGSKYVKAALNGNKECYGEVIASSKKRDLALIRLDCTGLTPLPLARKRPTEGTAVYAIGTPLTEKLRFSVTKGVVSGIRKEDGLDYIQSDVTVLAGSSGGPLLDASGNVVGVTSTGIAFRSVPVGVNFFVPVTDIAEHLPLQLE